MNFKSMFSVNIYNIYVDPPPPKFENKHVDSPKATLTKRVYGTFP